VSLQGNGAVQITLHVERTAEVGIGLQQRPAFEHQPAQHGRIAHHQRESRRLASRRIQRAVPEPQRSRASVAAHQALEDANGRLLGCGRIQRALRMKG